ncbi:histone deacetylase complex subunit SAP30L isoform X2 [Myxocyprinus asiaticus]|uniref:histone deacetylase complex subunit SAP30L isoform X2 n=1 Tax=Myxocyprinus asiaticus TaxID=70543 RepID=UPI002221AF95|nr:histone deacetylase complex subunit SAP30L isoform X2 [Myxocyprinus asiaticus]
MNGFSTEEDSHDGPPAPPFFGQSCCLIEDGERCGRSAGNASFSKRIQKSISQKKLKLDIDKSVRHLYICDFHKNFIQSVRNKRKRKTSDDGGESPDHDVEVPESRPDPAPFLLVIGLHCYVSLSDDKMQLMPAGHHFSFLRWISEDELMPTPTVRHRVIHMPLPEPWT